MRSPEDTAQAMLERYSSAKVAAEMAYWHAMDYERGTDSRTYWLAVYGIIQALRLTAERHVP